MEGISVDLNNMMVCCIKLSKKSSLIRYYEVNFKLVCPCDDMRLDA